MSAFSLDKRISNPASLQQLAAGIMGIFQDLEDALNSTPGIQPNIGQGTPRASIGDLQIFQDQGNITLKFVTANNLTVNVTLGPAITDLNSNYLGVKTTATTPTVLDFPLNNNWGFHINSATSKIYLTYNYSGAIKKVELT